MNPKEAYRQFCSREIEVPIFSQPWYLDSVCGLSGWDVLMVRKGDEIAATMPIQIYKKHGFRMYRMPHFTKYWGPYFPKKFRSEKQQQKLTIQLLTQLPRYDYFEQNLHPNIKNTLPFHWQKFDTSIRYTFTIDLTPPLDMLLNNIEGKYRNNKINKAKKLVRVVSNNSVEDFYRLQKTTFNRQGIAVPFSYDFFKMYDTRLAQKESRKMFFAVDDKNQIHAGLYLIWDEHTAYLLLAGHDSQLRNSGAGVLLIWKAIEFAKELIQKKQFDFLGSMIEPITKVRRSFGAIQTPYYQVSKYQSKLLLILDGLRNKF